MFETSACKIQTPGNYPEENIQHTEHGESLKSRLPQLVWHLSLVICTVLRCHCTYLKCYSHQLFSYKNTQSQIHLVITLLIINNINIILCVAVINNITKQ